MPRGARNRSLCEISGLIPLAPDDFEAALEKQRPQDTPVDQWGSRKEALSKWFVQRSGLVRASGAGYTFLHNQFLEFLAGEGLAADPSFAAHVAEAVKNVDAWR